MKVSLFSALLLVHKHGHLFIAMFVSESTIYIYTYTYIPILYVFFFCPIFPPSSPPSSYHPPIHLSIHPSTQPCELLLVIMQKIMWLSVVSHAWTISRLQRDLPYAPLHLSSLPSQQPSHEAIVWNQWRQQGCFCVSIFLDNLFHQCLFSNSSVSVPRASTRLLVGVM